MNKWTGKRSKHKSERPLRKWRVMSYHLICNLYLGFWCRIKTPRWLELHWNLCTDYFGFTWSELNVKATQLLRGKELAWVSGNPITKLMVTTSLRQWRGCFVSLLPTLTKLEAVQSWQLLKDLSLLDIFRLFLDISSAAITETPVSTGIAKFRVRVTFAALTKEMAIIFQLPLVFQRNFS